MIAPVRRSAMFIATACEQRYVALQVGLDDPVPPRLVALEEVAAGGLVGRERGVVDEHVDRAVGRDERRTDGVTSALEATSPMSAMAVPPAALIAETTSSARAGSTSLTATLGALAREPFGDRAPDAVTGAGHQHGGAFEAVGHVWTP